MTDEEMQTTIIELAWKLQDIHYNLWYNHNTMIEWSEAEAYDKYLELESLICKIEKRKALAKEQKENWND